MSRACGTCEEEEKCTQTFGVETQGGPLGSHMCGREDIKIHPKERMAGWDWIYQAQNIYK